MLDFFARLHFSSDTLAALNDILILVKHLMSLLGSLIVFLGSLFVVSQFLLRFMRRRRQPLLNFDWVRMGITRSIILGLEFFIAADLIQTTTTPDYYAVGILAAIVLIRAFLNYSLNRDLTILSQREQQEREQAAKVYGPKF
jgi:uncharacterized membrane protein